MTELGIFVSQEFVANPKHFDFSFRTNDICYGLCDVEITLRSPECTGFCGKTQYGELLDVSVSKGVVKVKVEGNGGRTSLEFLMDHEGAEKNFDEVFEKVRG